MSVHLTILIKKLDTISDADFHTYWSTSHPKIWLSVKVVKEKVVKYSQVCLRCSFLNLSCEYLHKIQ